MDGRRALVIDDEVHFRYFLRVLLEKAGFAVKMARNGIEALDVLRSWRPDVITLVTTLLFTMYLMLFRLILIVLVSLVMIMGIQQQSVCLNL